MTDQPTLTPPVVPDQSGKSLAFKIFIAIAILVGIAIASAIAAVMLAADVDSATDPTPIQFEETAESLPTSATGDWPSIQAYEADMTETMEFIQDTYSTMFDANEAYAAGQLTVGDFAELSKLAGDTTATHVDYFTGTTAPVGYEAVHEALLYALDLAWDGFITASSGEVADIDKGAALHEQAGAEFQRAATLLPTG